MKEIVSFKDGFATSSGEVKLYYFDASSGEYISSGEEFIAIGLGIPANACAVAPPVAVRGYATCRAGGEWVQIADHRGEVVYDTQTLQAEEVKAPGDYREGVTLLKPVTTHDKWDGHQWVTDEAAQAAAATASAEAEKKRLYEFASKAIEPLKDASDGGYIEEDDKSKLLAWQKYRYRLTKVDTSAIPVSFPVMP